ncbi:MAG: NADH-quinone oxidoreductase subunit C [Alphaproteobacteria bacterium]|nr:MAG: NADH-quinone oxidoreductase subunit C [Alphaproteobacteria bacterium]
MDEQSERLEALNELGNYIRVLLPDDVLGVVLVNGELTVSVRREPIVKILTALRDDTSCQMHQLIDICGVDYPDRKERFEVVYHLLSMRQNHRVRVKLTTDAVTPVPSVTAVYSAAGWWERETWDLFGVLFSGHPDLRRILTDYGFEGHPLRKDFPLTGYVEVRYDEQQKRVVYEPVKLDQEFRNFDFLSPWEGAEAMRQAMPGSGDGNGEGNG